VTEKKREEWCIELGIALKTTRTNAELTLEEASKRAKISRQYLYFIEKGERPKVSFDVMIRISNVYGISLDYLSQFVRFTS